MKQSEYIKLSEREGIEDKDIARILDYLERHSKEFTWQPINKNGFEEIEGVACVNGTDWLFNSDTVYIDISPNFEIPTPLLAQTIPSVYAYLINNY